PRYKGLAEERTSAISYPREGSMPITMEVVVLLVAATRGLATGMFMLLLITAWDFFNKPIMQFFQNAWSLVFCTAIVMRLFSGTAKAEEQDYVDVDGKQHYVVPITVEAPALTASDRLRVLRQDAKELEAKIQASKNAAEFRALLAQRR